MGGVFAFSPVVSGDAFIDALSEGERKEWENGTHRMPAIAVNGKSSVISSQYWDLWREEDVTKIADKIDVPVNIIQSNPDNVCPPENAKGLNSLLTYGRYQEVDGLNHDFCDNEGKVAAEKIKNAVDQAFAKNAPFEAIAQPEDNLLVHGCN